MTELAVVHVHTTLPGDALGVDVQGVALVDVVIQHRSQEVICRADGVKVTGKMEVNVLHGDHLGVSAAGSAALDAEHGAERRLSQGHDHVLPNAAHAVGQTDGGSGLALTGRGGGDGGDKDQLTLGTLALLQESVIHLGLIAAVGLQVLFIDASRFRDLADGLHFTALGNFDIGHVSVSWFNYLMELVVRRVTSWYPPSTILVEETTVSLASRCRSEMVITPQLHMVLLTL